MGCRHEAPVREGGPAGGGGNRLRTFPGGGEARGDILSKAGERDFPETGPDQMYLRTAAPIASI